MGWAAAAWQHCQIRKKSKVIANYANLPDNAHIHTYTHKLFVSFPFTFCLVHYKQKQSTHKTCLSRRITQWTFSKALHTVICTCIHIYWLYYECVCTCEVDVIRLLYLLSEKQTYFLYCCLLATSLTVSVFALTLRFVLFVAHVFPSSSASWRSYWLKLQRSKELPVCCT